MFLSRILEAKRREVEERSARVPLDELERLAARAPVPRDFAAALRPPDLLPAQVQEPDSPLSAVPGARAVPDSGGPTGSRAGSGTTPPSLWKKARAGSGTTPPSWVEGGGWVRDDPALLNEGRGSRPPEKGDNPASYAGRSPRLPRGNALAVVAEVKRASPSRGPIRPDLDAPALARQYEAGGCAAVSVLTDGPFFGARPDDLQAVRAEVSVPVLRKDFILSEYQLWESRAMGADAALLIVAALGDDELSALVRLSRELGMCPLVEVHTEGEARRALECGATVVGINNRDLTTFQVDIETTRRLRALVPPEVTVVAESGIGGPREAALVRAWGADAVLVGEALVACPDPRALVQAMIGQPAGYGTTKAQRTRGITKLS